MNFILTPRVYWSRHQRKTLHELTTQYVALLFDYDDDGIFVYRAKTTDISLKECSAYGQVDQGGAEREEPHIYELP